MSPVLAYVLGLGLALLASLAVVLVLRRPLLRLLVELCGNETRAGFWAAFSHVTLVLAPLLGALHRRPEAGADAVFEVSRQLEWALGGLLFAVLAVGLVLARFIAAFERQHGGRAEARSAASA